MERPKASADAQKNAGYRSGGPRPLTDARKEANSSAPRAEPSSRASAAQQSFAVKPRPASGGNSTSQDKPPLRPVNRGVAGSSRDTNRTSTDSAASRPSLRLLRP